MPQVIDIDGNALLEKYGSSHARKQRLRKNVQLLFLGLSAEETAPLITLLRTSRISPRGKQVNSEQEFLDALSERSWDLILCTLDRTDFTVKQAVNHIKRLEKDLPVIQVIPNSDSHLLLQGLKNQIQAVVPLDEKELLLINIRRELDHLDHRRRLRKAESALAEAEKRAQQLMESSKHGICCINGGKLTLCNESFLDLFGFEKKEQVVEKALTDFFIYEDRTELTDQINQLLEEEQSELILQMNGQRSDRSQFVANLELTVTELNGTPSVRVLFRIDDHHVGHLLSEDLDFVSGLYNKDYLHKQLETITQKALRGGNDCSLLCIELDQLDQIKARYGHEGSDQLIRDIAGELKTTVNKVHLLAHPVDNSFVIVFKDPSIDKAQAFAEQVCKMISDVSSEAAGVMVQSTCSIGLTLINDTAPPVDELIARTHLAIEDLREEKPQGDGIRQYQPPAIINDEHDARFEDIRRRIESKEFKLLFQPIVNLLAEDQTEQHYEVLLRLLDDEQSELSPNEFLSAAGDFETAKIVDHWVIEQSLKQLKRTLNHEIKNTLFINISAHALSDNKLLTWLSGVLRKNNIPAERLVFQISESDIAISPKQAQVFTEKLHKIHCRVCIKHYGSAPNAESILNMVYSDFVKVDGSYIQELGNSSEQDEQFFESVQHLSKLQKKTIAPLVEDTKAMATLWKAGFDYVQGYYLQPPRDNMDYDFFPE